MARSMSELASAFHALAGVPGASPWDPAALGRFAAQATTPRAARLAAIMLLTTWREALAAAGLDEPSDDRHLPPLTAADLRDIRARWVRLDAGG